MSYNQDAQNSLKLKHLFLPNAAVLSGEIIFALIALFTLNINNIGSKFTNQNDNTSPVAFSGQLLDKMWGALNDSYAFQQISLFILWALAGMFAYILIFRLIQIISGVSYSVKNGFQYVKTDSSRGFFRWLDSLHDFFIKLLITISGILLFGYGAFACFGLASQQFETGLAQSYPAYIAPLLISVLSAIIGIRVIMAGLCLLSRRFRNFYYA